MESLPIIDLGRAAELAVTRMLAEGRIVGRDGEGRRVIEVAVDDWVVDWFSPPRRRRSKRISQAPTASFSSLYHSTERKT